MFSDTATKILANKSSITAPDMEMEEGAFGPILKNSVRSSQSVR